MDTKNSIVSSYERAEVTSKFHEVMSAEGINSDEVELCLITRINAGSYNVIYLNGASFKGININIDVGYKSIW